MESALSWLARHQYLDGSWSQFRYPCSDESTPCHGSKNTSEEEHYNVGLTGLSVLAFLAAGHSPVPSDSGEEGPYAGVLRKAIEYLLANQGAEGVIGNVRGLQGAMYCHLVSTAAVLEAYGMTRSKRLEEAARKALDWTLAAQNPGKGWRYSPRSGNNDTSVTGWGVLVLKLAQWLKFTVPQSAFDGAHAHYEEVTDKSFKTGYTHKGSGRVYTPGVNEKYEPHDTMTAIAVYGRHVMRKKPDKAMIKAAISLLSKDLPEWSKFDIDYYYWHQGTIALHRIASPRSKEWKNWNKALKGVLLPNQHKSGCLGGSWDPVARWSLETGRVYSTAINALTLETYYRYKWGY